VLDTHDAGDKTIKSPTSYAAAGVDIGAGERAVDLMRPAIAGAQKLANRFGSFGAAVPSPGGDMLLVSSADGVGTKLCLARTDADYAGLGRDLVHHCINDILTAGALPIFFLDYLAFAKLNPQRAATIVHGMSAACSAHACALVGGETAELPDLYQDDALDIAGFIVGAVAKDSLIDGTAIRQGDTLIGLPSAGLHTNGYSLARLLLADRLDEPFQASSSQPGELPGDVRQHGGPVTGTIREALLSEHRCYLEQLSPLLDQRAILGLAHITGGGLPGNVPRMLPEGLGAHFDRQSWQVPAIFQTLQTYNIAPIELYRTFNMGIGMVLACRPEASHLVLDMVQDARIIGSVIKDRDGARITGLW
jgi:phosphoribosylformylglycinamidine cyclo-ligase